MRDQISTNPPVMRVCLPWQKIFPNYESFFTSKLYLLIILEISEALSLIKVNELRKFRAIWYMGIPYIPHHVIVKPLKKCAQMAQMLLLWLVKPWLLGINKEIEFRTIWYMGIPLYTTPLELIQERHPNRARATERDQSRSTRLRSLWTAMKAAGQ